MNQKPFLYADIESGECFSKKLTHYEKHTLTFCQQWLKGNDQFEIHTSGSTGKPKKIIAQRDKMEASANMTGRVLGLAPKDKVLVCLSTKYIAGMMMLVRGFTLGLEMHISEPTESPSTLFPANKNFDFTALVPLQLNKLLMSKSDRFLQALNQMKAIIIGGTFINHDLQQAIEKMEVPIYETYGMTETFSHIALKRINGPEKDSYFTTLEGIKVSQDRRDCLVIHATSLSNIPIITNDIVELKSDYQFMLKGRIDNIINSGAVKIQPEELEKKIEPILSSIHIKTPFFISGVSDDLLGEKVVLFIESRPLDKIKKQGILDIIQSKLPPYFAPKEIKTRSEFLYTKSGKIKRKETARQ